jgi:hypothetical protein
VRDFTIIVPDTYWDIGFVANESDEPLNDAHPACNVTGCRGPGAGIAGVLTFFSVRLAVLLGAVLDKVTSNDGAFRVELNQYLIEWDLDQKSIGLSSFCPNLAEYKHTVITASPP